MALRLPSGSTGLSVSHSQTDSGTSSGSAKTVAAGKVGMVTSVRGVWKGSSSVDCSIRVLVNGLAVHHLFSNGSDGDDVGGDRINTVSAQFSPCITLDEGDTLNVEIEVDNNSGTCSAIVEAHEFTP